MTEQKLVNFSLHNILPFRLFAAWRCYVRSKKEEPFKHYFASFLSRKGEWALI